MRAFRKLVILAAVALAFAVYSAPASAEIDWVHDLEAGFEEALERNAPIFIFFCQET